MGVAAGDMVFSYNLLLVAVVLLVRATVIYRKNEYTVTDRRLITKSGFIKKHTHENFISKIESVNVSQDILERCLDYGTVVVNGTGGTRQVFKNIAFPFEFRTAVQKAQSLGNQKTVSCPGVHPPIAAVAF